ncbi:MAG TPA: HD domain-containing protein [Candidatus Limnocylindrales bacterium]|nr:HD domain-containing protein [Candidatus Limnocylindrales bacterium]
MEDAPGYLRTMPLHAITEVFGEQGLRDRFRLEIRDLPEPDRARLLEALDLASELHHDQRRVREPYLNHLLRVTLRILVYYHVNDVEVLVAALLHDAVEDQPWRLVGRPEEGPPPTEEALAVIAQRFGPRVARLVECVTNPDWDPHRDRNEQYRAHVEEALRYEPWARVIKISDFTDNGVGVIHTTGPKLVKAATKYAPLVPALRELIARADTPLTGEVKQHIYNQLDLATQRFEAILSR